MYLSKKGFVVRKDKIGETEIAHLRKDLRGRPLQDEKYSFYGTHDNTFPLYVETVNKMYIPKMYGISRYGLPSAKLAGYVGTAWGDGIEFVGTLLPHQNEPVEVTARELLQGSSGGILSLQTGMGKSVCALKVLARLKVRTIIVVNKVTLLKQWESEIKRFLPKATVGILQGQDKIDVEGKDIIIGMLQSLSRINYPDDLFDGIGCTLIDEVHNTSSRVFSQVLMKLCSRYTLGLSATPKRSDGCEYVFKWFLGDIVYQSAESRKGLPPVINVVKIDSSEYKEIATLHKFTGQKQIMYSSMITDLIAMDKRNALILSAIKKLVTEENRKVLVLSDRRSHLKILKSALDSDSSVTFTYGLFLGQMKIQDLERSKASNVILASTQAFGEGVSEKELDTLMLVTPKKFIGHLKNTSKNESGRLEQIVGRIFRKDHVDKHPLIVDFNDNFSVYKTQSRQRRTFYKQHFRDVLFKEQTINLDKHSLDEVHMDCVETKRDDEKATSNAVEECIDSLCILED